MKKLVFAMLIAGSTALACNSSEGKSTADSKATEKTATEAAAEGKAIHLTNAMFKEQIMDYEKNPKEWVYKGEKPGIIDFYADWCRPCKITSPILDELAQEYAGKINIYKVNVDQERELASMFGISSIPAFLYMPMEGNPTMGPPGIAPTPEETKEMFKQYIDEILLQNKEM